jgi:hypothetical protein
MGLRDDVYTLAAGLAKVSLGTEKWLRAGKK